MPRYNYLNPPEDARSPQDVRIVDLKVEPAPDNQRIRVMVEITPFRERPDLTAILYQQDEEVTTAHIIETIDTHMAFTLHIRNPSDDPNYVLAMSVSYQEYGEVDQRQVAFRLPAVQD
jgi:hypothetical protein